MTMIDKEIQKIELESRYDEEIDDIERKSNPKNFVTYRTFRKYLSQIFVSLENLESRINRLEQKVVRK